MIYVRFLMPSTTNIARSPVVDFGGRTGPSGAIGAGGNAEAVTGIVGASAGAPAGRGANKSVCRYVIMVDEVLLGDIYRKFEKAVRKFPVMAWGPGLPKNKRPAHLPMEGEC